MNRFFNWTIWAPLALAAVFSLSAAAPPAEQLLPEDTLAVASVRDWDQSLLASTNSPYSQLWRDPALKPFRDKFETRFAEMVQEPLEKELGIKFSDYKDIVHGQITLGLLPSTAPGQRSFDFVLILDAKNQTETAKTALEALRKKWVAGGQQTKIDKIRDLEFSHLAISKKQVGASLKKLMPGAGGAPDDDEAEKDTKVEVMVGQSQSLILVGNSIPALEKVVGRQSGALVAPLADQAGFQLAQAKSLRDAQVYVLLLGRPLYELLSKFAADEKAAAVPGLKPAKLMAASGLGGVQAFSFKAVNTPDGLATEFFTAVPEASRKGLFSIFLPQAKDSAPTPFVPVDAVKFQRIRLDGQKTWAGIEGFLGALDPSLSGLLQLTLGAAGKDKNPDFDLKKSLIGNLGDDWITYQKLPKTLTADSLRDSPTTVLIGSPNAGQLLAALRTTVGILPPPLGSTPLGEREFLGRKIFTLTLSPAVDEADVKVAAQTVSFSTSGGYVVFSRDPGAVEEYLRASDNPGKNLRDTPGLAQAAEAVGGMSTGLFGFENQAETIRATFELLRKDPAAFDTVLLGVPMRVAESAPGKGWQTLFDFSLLPPFDQVSRYFSVQVNSLAVTADGFSYKTYAPVAPGLKK